MPARFGMLHRIYIHRSKFQVSLSTGACMFPAGADSETALLRRADFAMYAAKRLGGNDYSFFGAAVLPQRQTQLPWWETLPADVIDEQDVFSGVPQ